MTEYLGDPVASRFPTLGQEHVRVVPAGTHVGRIFFAGGRHPMTWREFRYFGPTTSRFDPHPPPAQLHAHLGIMYVAPAMASARSITVPVLKTCLAEVFRDTGHIDLQADLPYFASFVLRRDLVLLDLADSEWLSDADGNAAISSGPREQSRKWARAIAGAYPNLDGLIYPSSHNPAARSAALWRSSRSAIPARSALHMPLSDLALRDAIELYADQMRLMLL